MVFKIEVIGLGAGGIDQLPLGIYRKLLAAERHVFTRTIDHPVIVPLQAEGVRFQSFDTIYEKETTFEAVYEQIIKKLIEESEQRSVIYAVPGHPMLAEYTVQRLLEEVPDRVEVVGGQSFLDDLFTSLKIDPIEGFQFVDATHVRREQLCYTQHLIFCQVYDRYVASEVKLMLLEDLPAHYEIIIVDAVGTDEEQVKTVPLEQLDRIVDVSNLMTVYVPPVPKEQLNHTFINLKNVIATLRGENGCPWDRKQTHETLRPYALEEVYELIDAINRKDDEGIVEELGDVLLQVMLHSQIGADNGYFTIDDVIRSITEKMIHRHPAVFSDEADVKTWDELKRAEKQETEATLLLESIIMESPALFVSHKIQARATKVGFDWDSVEAIWEKFLEEKAEFTEAVQRADKEAMEKEFGDLLFVLVNIANFYDVHPELALQRTNEKFVARFNYIETTLREQGITLQGAPNEMLEKYWQKAKAKE